MNVKHIYGKSGLYDVVLTVDDGSGLNNGTSSKNNLVQVLQQPNVEAGKDLIVCPGEQFILNGRAYTFPGNEEIVFNWLLEDGIILKGSSVNYTIDVPGIYNIILEAGYKIKPDIKGIDTLRVIVNSTPVAEAGKDQEVLIGGLYDTVAF